MIPRDQRYLLLLSHMRSYSSVLAHVLGSSPEINGCGETNVKYRRTRDLRRLRCRVRRSIGEPLHGRWLLDKILHNGIRPPDAVIGMERARAVIFLRAPESALASIVTLAHVDTGIGYMRCPQQACDYYVARLHRLRTDGERLRKLALYFDAEALIATPQRILAALTQWLELETPLTQEYRTCRSTGAWGFGDPLKNIHSGRILDGSQASVATSSRIPKSVLAEASAAYWRCKEALLCHCEIVDGGVLQKPAAGSVLINADVRESHR